MSSFGQIFSKDTQAIFYNWKPSPVQRMLDFDFLCGASFSLSYRKFVLPALLLPIYFLGGHGAERIVA